MTHFICDGNSLFARSFFAARSISSEPIEALGLMIRTILILLDPDASKIGTYFDTTFFGWDNQQNPLKRREKKPPHYHETKEVARDVLSLLFGTVHCDHPQYEGDDIVATAAFSVKQSDNVYIISADKDLQQLQSDRVNYYCLNTKAVISKDYIIRKWHICRPAQVALALAIIGDPVDNIKGMAGWGPVKCRRLFEAVNDRMNFEEALNTIVAQIPENRQEEFFAALDRTLLHTDVPGVKSPAPLKLASPKVVRDLKIPGISLLYARVYDSYAAGQRASNGMDPPEARLK